MTSSSSTNASSKAPEPVAPSGDVVRRTRYGSRRAHRSSVGRQLGHAGLWLCVAVLALAPLSAGGVHRVSMTLLMVGALLGLGLFALGAAAQGRVLRIGVGAILPLALMLVALVQSIPLPHGLRSAIDPNGSSLLSDNDIAPVGVWPLSLDPVSTRVHIGMAAAGLALFIFAYHLASGQSRRHLVLRVLGLTGVVALTIGLGHRVLGFGKLYGFLNATWRTPLVGPFVNSNHTAEFLELSAFVCLACSFQRPTALNRVGWLVGTFLCAGGAFATLSRGSVVALALGVVVFAFLRFIARDGDPSNRRHRSSLVWGAFLVALVVLGGLAFGAGQLIDRFRSSSVGADVRFRLWRDGLHVLAAHPFGIGRGAFDRVYPVYRTIDMPFPVRFAFLENEPLQLLIDLGWLFFALVGAATAAVGWRVVKHGRRDPVESALLAALFAVLVHNFVDFGLETLGVLLPFMAVLGAVLGRMHAAKEDSPASRRSVWALLAAAALGLVLGAASLLHGSSDNFDALLKRGRPAPDRQALLLRAQSTHPLDYFYALAYARVAPLKGAPGAASPRLHALNRALRLCPSCEMVHTEIARNLWQLGLRRQALLEWRSAVDLNPRLLAPTMGELYAAGAKATELTAVASSDPARIVEVASFLSDRGKVAEAFTVLDQADALGAARSESLIMRATLQMQAGQNDAVTGTLQAARAAGIQDARLALLEARFLSSVKGPGAADEALALLDVAAARYPMNLEVQRARVGLVTQYQKWTAVARSLEGLKLALYHAQGSATEAHVASARINARLGRWQSALGEYRVALGDDPSSVPLWMEFGNAAATIGRNTTAREAYAEASRLSPNSPDITAALKKLDEQQARLRAIPDEGPPLLKSNRSED